jgi:hypothetical protein
MDPDPSLAQEIDALEQKRLVAIEQEKINRDAAFLHSAKFPLNEHIEGFEAAPFCPFHSNLLMMMNSPFMPPFETPAPGDLAAFLWVVNPKFSRSEWTKRKFFKSCRSFFPPSPPIFKTKFMLWRHEQQSARALVRMTKVVIAAREYVMAALNDRPPARGITGLEEPVYYSDFCSIAAVLMRNYHGLDYERIQFMPWKVIYQFLKEVREYAAAGAGENPLLWNGSDRYIDEQLALLNRKN